MSDPQSLQRSRSTRRAPDVPTPGADVYHLLKILARVTRRIVDAEKRP